MNSVKQRRDGLGLQDLNEHWQMAHYWPKSVSTDKVRYGILACSQWPWVLLTAKHMTEKKVPLVWRVSLPKSISISSQNSRLHLCWINTTYTFLTQVIQMETKKFEHWKIWSTWCQMSASLFSSYWPWEDTEIAQEISEQWNLALKRILEISRSTPPASSSWWGQAPNHSEPQVLSCEMSSSTLTALPEKHARKKEPAHSLAASWRLIAAPGKLSFTYQLYTDYLEPVRHPAKSFTCRASFNPLLTVLCTFLGSLVYKLNQLLPVDAQGLSPLKPLVSTSAQSSNLSKTPHQKLWLLL